MICLKRQLGRNLFSFFSIPRREDNCFKSTDVRAYFIFGAGAGAFGSKLNIWSPNWSFQLPTIFFRAGAGAFGSKLNIWSPIWSFQLPTIFFRAGAGAFSSKKKNETRAVKVNLQRWNQSFCLLCFRLQCKCSCQTPFYVKSNSVQLVMAVLRLCYKYELCPFDCS